MSDLNQRTILITGATDGAGKQTAHDLAERGATLLLHGRDRAKGEATLGDIRRATGNDRLTYYLADFSSLTEVRRLAEELQTDHESLDVLINNAGIGGGKQGEAQREVSNDSYELRFAVNYLAPFLLTRLLLPVLRKGASPRIVNVSSVGQRPIDFDDVMLEHAYDGIDAYCQSKLAQIMFTFDLAEQLRGDGVTVNALHPASLMNTRMVNESFGQGSATSSVAEGAEAIVYVATSSDLSGITGRYFDQQREARANAQAYDSAARKQLRELSEQLTGLYPQGYRKVRNGF